MKNSEMNEDIVSLIKNSKEKIFIILGNSSTGKTEIINKLSDSGYKTIDNYSLDGPSFKEDFIKAPDKIIVATHCSSLLLYKFLYHPTAVIIVTHRNSLYDIFYINDFIGREIPMKLTSDEYDLSEKLMRISEIYWSEFLQSLFDKIDIEYISSSRKKIHQKIFSNIQKLK